MKKEINSEIMKSLNKIVKYVSIALVPIGILLLLRQFSINGNTTQNAVVTVVAAVVGMIPGRSYITCVYGACDKCFKAF